MPQLKMVKSRWVCMGQKRYNFRAIPDPDYTSGQWIVKVWNFAITRYGSGY